MPLKKGNSKKIISENISEFHTGKTYSATKNKFGKVKADTQAIAVALTQARKSNKPTKSSKAIVKRRKKNK
jgi:hypothetical protein